MSSEKVHSFFCVMIMRDCWRWLCCLSLVMMSLEETAQCIFLLLRTLYGGGPNKCSQNTRNVTNLSRSHRMLIRHALGACSYSSARISLSSWEHRNRCRQGEGVYRKHGILVLIRPVLFQLLPVNEEEAADRFGMCM